MAFGEGLRMRCTVCGGTRFVATEYNTGDGRTRVPAPALECVKCLAIVLEEGVARSDEERESVKMAIAMRAAVQDAPPVQDDRDPFVESERPAAEPKVASPPVGNPKAESGSKDKV